MTCALLLVGMVCAFGFGCRLCNKCESRAVVRYLEAVCSKSYGRKHTAVKKCSEIASEAILAKNILFEVNFESCYISRL